MPDYKSSSIVYNARLSTQPLIAVTQALSMADLIAVPLTCHPHLASPLEEMQASVSVFSTALHYTFKSLTHYTQADSNCLLCNLLHYSNVSLLLQTRGYANETG